MGNIRHELIEHKRDTMDIERVKQDLSNAGCCKELTNCVLKRIESGNIEEALMLIKKIRCQAMDELHESGRKVDCIDFMIRNIEKYMINN